MNIVATIFFYFKLGLWLIYAYVSAVLIGFFGSKQTQHKILHKFSNSFLRLFNYKLDIQGQPKLTKGRNHIVVCNHQSLLDIPISFAALKNLHVGMIAKLDLFKMPLLGFVMRTLGVYKLDNKNLPQAIKDLKVVEQDMQTKGLIPWICPEGTRTKTLNPLKKGAFRIAKNTNAIIIPMCIHKVYDLLVYPIKRNRKITVTFSTPIDIQTHEIDEAIEIITKRWKTAY